MGHRKPVIMICPKCGSDNICKDAAATWDCEAQAWELASVHDCETCNDCGYEGDFMANRVALEEARLCRKSEQADRIIDRAEQYGASIDWSAMTRTELECHLNHIENLSFDAACAAMELEFRCSTGIWGN